MQRQLALFALRISWIVLRPFGRDSRRGVFSQELNQ